MRAVVEKTLHWIGETQDPMEMFERIIAFEEKQYLFWSYTMDDLLAIKDQTVLYAVIAILASPFYEDEKMKFLLSNDAYLGLMSLKNYHMENSELWRRLEYLLGYIVAQMVYRAKPSAAAIITVPPNSWPYLTLVYLARSNPVRYDYFSFWWTSDQPFIPSNQQPLIYELIQKLREKVLPYNETSDSFAMTTESSYNVYGITGYNYSREFRDPKWLHHRDN